MPRSLNLIICAALTLSGVVEASASQIRTENYGDGSAVRTTGYGRGPLATFRYEGDGNDVEAFAGPCPGGRPTLTILRGTGQRRLLIAPCILD